MVRKIALLLTLTATAGCGTIAATNVEYGPRIYGGVRYDVADLGVDGFPLGTLCGLLDFPFSFVADTLMLPVTIVNALGAEPASTVIVDGFVVEAEKQEILEVEAVPSGPLPSRLKPLASAQVRVASLVATTDASGYFSLRRQAGDPWATIRIECAGYRPVDVGVSELRSLDNRKYWQDHSLRVRLQRQ